MRGQRSEGARGNMVVRMIRWPWTPVIVRKFQVRLVVRGIASAVPPPPESAERMVAEVRWKGPKMMALSSLRRTVKRNNTKEEVMSGDYGEVEWNEEFESVIGLMAHKENAFHPWEIDFVVFYGAKQVFKNRASIVGMASLNLAEYASASGEELELNLPLLMASVDSDSRLILHLTLKLLELRTCQDSHEILQRSMIPIPVPPSPEVAPPEKDELSALKARLRKVKILTEFVSTRKSKKTCQLDEVIDGRYSTGSEDTDYAYPIDTDSLDDNPDEKLEDGEDDISIRKSFSYQTLATANYVDGAFYCDMKINREYRDWIYYSHPRSDGMHSHVEEATSSASEQYIMQTNKRSIFPWRKRKYSFRSPNARGEPLLKKAYGDEGGDDIDNDRRQLSSSDESLPAMRCMADDHGSVHLSCISDFGDDNFAVGSWESKEIISRDGLMKLSTTVFFASIDQRSEKAAGQSACTALVAILADWFKSNQEMMPIKSQFDSLIREGSLQWRNLCEDQTYREQFPDKHFDLETVLQAKIRPLSVVPEKSFIGFFHPDGCKDNSGFEFLHGAMSLDNIWHEITRAGSDCLYIVSWNDHFFVLKVEQDAYYIIDTLGERLYEGCNQAYILKFDERTEIHRLPNEKEKKTNSEEHSRGEESKVVTAAEEELVCSGKDSCKEYIKSFLAAVPVRELQADIKKGLIFSTPLHHRLQIEFHYTEAAKNMVNLAETFPLPISWPIGRLPPTGPT